jgi:hypothetical protein
MRFLPDQKSAGPDTHAPRNYGAGQTQRRPALRRLTLILTGIMAEDYLQWIRDPDPPPVPGLRLVSAKITPSGQCIQLELIAAGEPATPEAAALAVGFPITPEVAQAFWSR